MLSRLIGSSSTILLFTFVRKWKSDNRFVIAFEKFSHKIGHINVALADQAMVSATNFATNILLARALGLEAFGTFTFSWIVIQLFNGVLASLLALPMMTIGPKQADDQRNAYYGTVIALQTVLSCLLFFTILIGAIATAHYLPRFQTGDIALPLAGAVATYQAQDFLRRYFFSQHRPDRAFLNDLVRCGCQSAALITLACLKTPTVAETLWIFAATAAVALALGGLSIRATVSVWRREALRTVILSHWTLSKWLVVSNFLQWGTNNIYFILTGIFLGAPVAGGLRAAANFTGFVNIISLGLSNVTAAHAAAEYSRGGARPLIAYIRRSALRGLVIVTLFCIVIGAAPGFWLTLAFGKAFATYQGALLWFAVIQPFAFLEMPLTAALLAVEYTAPFFFEYLGANLVTFAFTPLLIHAFGLTGVMIGLSLSWIYQISFLAFSLRAKLRRQT